MAVVINPVFSPASPQAWALHNLFVVTLIVCGVIFLLVAVLVGTSIVRFHQRRVSGEPTQVTGNQRLEITWTIIPLLILIFLFVRTMAAMRVSDPAPDRPPDLTIIGHQWWWEVRYANGAVTANEIHIATGSNQLASIQAADVIHSYWVPQLGRKIDAIPGYTNSVWLRADAPGEYGGTCAEYCGAQHAWMRLLVIAEAPEQFDRWVRHEAQQAAAAASEAARRGADVFRQKTCMNCHVIRGLAGGTPAGPDLTHVATRQTLGSGVIANTPENLRRWLANPQAIKPAINMPNFQLTETEIADLAAYLETLK